MTREIKKVTVVGAGVMGAGIAAHLANAGVEVNLLDIVLPNEPDRNKLAQAGLDRMLKADLATAPFNAGLMDKRNAKRIRPGNVVDDLERAVKESDWLIEVVKEDLAIKQDLFARIEACGNPDIMVTSNTSTIPLSKLTDGRGDNFKRNFAITHWFNPPRIMRLMELVGGKDTAPETLSALEQFCDVRLGKKVIHSNDRPGFIANRIGTYFLSRSIFAAQDANLKIEEVDAVLSRPMGFPKTGVFGLLDVVGVGLIPLVTKSLKSNLPDSDAFVKQYREPELLNTMLADGRTGRMSPKGGFYRMQRQSDGSKLKEAIDLTTGTYRPAEKPKLQSVAAGKKGPRAVFETPDKAGKFAWDVMRDTLTYAISLVPDVTSDIASIDAAMREGYQWKRGPFELLDQIGPKWFADKLKSEKRDVPPALAALLASGLTKFYTIENGKASKAVFDNMKTARYAPVERADGVLDLGDIKRVSKPVLTNPSASVWDIGDKVLCLEFHSKMNTLDPLTLKMINDTIRTINAKPDQYKALVIYNDAKDFSVGANLGLAALFLQIADHPYAKKTHFSSIARKGMQGFIGELIFQGQAAYKALREAPFPVIGAPSGMALGGGCEILLHCDAIQADSELYTGLVEVGVGIIPGWGGNVRLLERALAAEKMKGPIPALRTAAMVIMNPPAAISASAQDAKSKLWLRPQDGITMNRDRLLADAKAKALELVPGYTPPKPAIFSLPGPAGKNALRMAIDGFYIKGGDPNRGGTTHYDVVVGEAVAHALTGGDTLTPADAKFHTDQTIDRNFTVNPSLRLTEDRMLQMERDGFMALIKRPETEKRIRTMIATNKPFREPAPEPAPEPSAIRAGFQIAAQELRHPTGKPVVGEDANRLEKMAQVTRILFKLFPKLAQ